MNKLKSVKQSIKENGIRQWVKWHGFRWVLYLSPVGLRYHKWIYSRICRKSVGKRKMTSISDDGIYPLFCLAASKNDRILKSFKKNPYYMSIVETITNREFGWMMMNYVLRYGVDESDWNVFLRNETIGGARKYTYNAGGYRVSISPTTLKYIKVFQDIRVLFDISTIRSVVEIGIGYGGQCNVIMNMLSLNKYYLIDLPEVLELAKRYLNAVGQKNRSIVYVDGLGLDKSVRIGADLFVSNYAFCELHRDVQDLYFDSVIDNCKMGYMIYNSMGHDNYGSYSENEIVKRIDGAYIINEEPLTGERNCVIIWNRNEKR